MASSSSHRIARFDQVLFGSREVDIPRLADMCLEDNIPDEIEGLRSLCWQLLLGHLPPQRNQWKSALSRSQQAYKELLGDIASRENETNAESLKRLRTQIHADVSRTLPDVALLHSSSDTDDDTRCSTIVGSESVSPFPQPVIATTLQDRIAAAVLPSDTNIATSHTEAMERVLFAYSQFNPGAGYAQGMNEILAPLYYVIVSSGGTEADAFHMLALALREVHLDMFIATDSGLQQTLGKWWNGNVREADPELFAWLTEIGIRPEDFALRWVLVWGAREFSLPLVLVLWDALLAARVYPPKPDSDLVSCALSNQSSDKRFVVAVADAGRLRCELRVWCGVSGDDSASRSQLGFLLDLCTAILGRLRRRLLSAPFDECLGLLQHLPPDMDIRLLLQATIRLRQRRAAERAAIACRAVLASVDDIGRRSSHDYEDLLLSAPIENTDKLSRFFNNIFHAPTQQQFQKMPPLSAPTPLVILSSDAASEGVDCLLIVVPLPNKQVQVLEVVGSNKRTHTATVRPLGECNALRPSLANAVVYGGKKQFSVGLLTTEGNSSDSEDDLPLSALMVQQSRSSATISWGKQLPAGISSIELCDYDSD